MGTIADKLTYLGETKSDLRATLNGLLGLSLDADTPFRRYAYEADMAAMRSMFASGELGGYWEPTLSSYYEDSAGTIPASLNGVVGAILNKPFLNRETIVSATDTRTLTAVGTAPPVVELTEYAGEPCQGVTFAANDGGYNSSRAQTTSLAAARAGDSYELLYRISTSRPLISGEAITSYVVGTWSLGQNPQGNQTPSQSWVNHIKTGIISGSSQLLFTVMCTCRSPITVYVRQLSLIKTGSYAALQATTANKPYLRKTPTTNRYWLDGNTATANLTATFPSSLGSSCTIARLDPELGVQWSENQTIGTTFNLITPYAYHGPMLIINRALTAAEKAVVARVLGRFMPELGPELVVNGTFDTDVSGWTAMYGGVLSVDSSRLKVENGLANYGTANQNISVKSGSRYLFSASLTKGTSTNIACNVGTSPGGLQINQFVSAVTSGYRRVLLAPVANIHFAFANSPPTLGAYSFFDNASVRELI